LTLNDISPLSKRPVTGADPHEFTPLFGSPFIWGPFLYYIRYTSRSSKRRTILTEAYSDMMLHLWVVWVEVFRCFLRKPFTLC